MPGVTTYPRIKSVVPGPDKILVVQFQNGEWREYDCKPLLHTEAFRPLAEEAVFRCAHPDSHGYGVVWNDAVDLAESEIWLNGRVLQPDAPGKRTRGRGG